MLLRVLFERIARKSQLVVIKEFLVLLNLSVTARCCGQRGTRLLKVALDHRPERYEIIAVHCRIVYAISPSSPGPSKVVRRTPRQGSRLRPPVNAASAGEYSSGDARAPGISRDTNQHQ